MSEPFDRDALLDRVDNDVEFLEETIAILDDDGPGMLMEIHEAAAGQDAQRLARAAHAFKGMVSNFCAAPAEAAARRIEQMGRDGAFEGVEEAVEGLEREVERLKTALEELAQDMG